MGQKTQLWEGAVCRADKQQAAARSDTAQAAGEQLCRQLQKAAAEIMLWRRHPAPPPGMAAPHGLCPPLPSLPLLPPSSHPRASQHAAPAHYHCKAAALCISIPRRTASVGFLRCQHPQGHSTNPNPPAMGLPASWDMKVPCGSPPRKQIQGFSPFHTPGMLHE